MTIVLPDEVERRFTPDDLRLHLALGLFLDRHVTLGQAAKVAGVSQSEFIHELGNRRIPMHYDEADALADIAVAECWSK
jgi:predicted HTH domain antitoxin